MQPILLSCLNAFAQFFFQAGDVLVWTAKAKIESLNKAGVPVADCPSQIPKLLKEKLGAV